MIRRFRVRPRCCSIRRLVLVLMLGALAVPCRGADPSGPEWPFVPPKRPAAPAVRLQTWLRNPIDAFVLAALEKGGLQPNPPADKTTLLRRVTFDLTGLMPTPAERDAFLADNSPDAYERLVERLLRSPRFGERWAQHWLDVVRYAETEGFKIDRLRPEAYRYRDYVIRACNDDLPYDRFLRQQIAGDQLEPENPDAAIATGFFRLHPEESNGSNYRQARQDMLDDITDVFGSSFLGLTVGCARCHDHKFDPLAQRDYYRLQAFFTPMMQRDELPLASAAERQRYQEQLAEWETATREMRQKCDVMLLGPRRAIFVELVATFDAETQLALKAPAEKRSPLQQQLAALAGKQIDRRLARAHRRLSKTDRAVYDDLQKKIAACATRKPDPLPIAMGVQDLGSEPPPTYRLGTGNYRKPRERVQPGFLSAVRALEPTGEKKGSGAFFDPGAKTVPDTFSRGLRRADLALWLCRPEHPLTSRVIVNRLWQHHLGTGIVATPNDFGVQGGKPTHPELLDWLATELAARGWRLKELHRLIVTSATYRQSSAPGRNPSADKARKVDPDDKLLWHARIKRREAEAIRDAVLQTSGQLNVRMYGPSNCPELPAALADYGWDADECVLDRNRRSIYLRAKRNFVYPLFAAFDEPDRVNSCPVRPATVTAPQALAMLNGEFTLAQSRHLAGALLTAHGRDVRALVRAAYLRAFSREPDGEDAASARKFLARQARLIGAKGPFSRDALPEPMPAGVDASFAAAVVDFCHALLNSAEFLDVE